MGVLYDYFRAPSVELVQKELAERGSQSLVTGGHESPVFDGAEFKGIDDTVVLGQFVAFATDQPWSTRLIGSRLIWPDGAEQDTEHEGPWVVVLDDQVRDILAAIPPDRLPELSERWAGIEEFRGTADPAGLHTAAALLIALATRARSADESLFCWICL